MFKFTIESTKDVKRINIEFGDETSEIVVNSDETPTAVEPQAEPSQSVPAKAKKNHAHKYDPFERAANTTNYAVKDKPKANSEPQEPEVKEDVSNRPAKVDSDFGNANY